MTGEAFEQWVRERLSHLPSGARENVIGALGCPGAILRTVFDLGQEWQIECQAGHGRRLLEQRSDTDEVLAHAITPVPDTEPEP